MNNNENPFLQYPDLLESRQRVRGILLDFFLNQKIKANVLIAAYDSGISTALEACDTIDNTFATRYIKILISEYAIQPDMAKWGVTYWIDKYGTQVLGKRINISGTISDEYTANEKNTDPVIQLLKDKDIEYIDKRNKQGCLWIIEKQGVSEIVKILEKSGVYLYYKDNGGTSTSGRPAYWTKKNTNGIKLVLNGDSHFSNKNTMDIEPMPYLPKQIIDVLINTKPLSEMKMKEKFPKSCIKVDMESFQKLGINSFSCVVRKISEDDEEEYPENWKGGDDVDWDDEEDQEEYDEEEDDWYDEADDTTCLRLTGDYEGTAEVNIFPIFLLFNAKGQLIDYLSEYRISKDFSGSVTYSVETSVPKWETIGRVEVKAIIDPCIWTKDLNEWERKKNASK